MKHTTLAIIPQSHLVSSNYSCCGLIVLRWIASIVVFMAHCIALDSKYRGFHGSLYCVG